jgi:cysteine-rich repeat protein
VDVGEECDDGANGILGDGCRDDCTAERCGDGVRDPSEDCDWNILSERENCNADCLACDACNVCGDGITGPGEQCDDGNMIEDDECNNMCEYNLG